MAVWRAGPLGDRIPSHPPFLVVEILSPEDRPVRLQPKIREYLADGVECVWVIDPDDAVILIGSRSQDLQLFG